MNGLEISWDTVQGVLLGMLSAAWFGLAAYHVGLRARIKRLEDQHVSREEYLQVIEDVATIKRILFLVAHKLGVPNDSLNR